MFQGGSLVSSHFYVEGTCHLLGLGKWSLRGLGGSSRSGGGLVSASDLSCTWG